MKLVGTKFEIKVWKYLKKIPKGRISTYKSVAKAIGFPGAARAVANACAANKYYTLIPCHRVVRSDFKIGGYSAPGGINKKKILLKNEKIDVNQLFKYKY